MQSHGPGDRLTLITQINKNYIHEKEGHLLQRKHTTMGNFSPLRLSEDFPDGGKEYQDVT